MGNPRNRTSRTFANDGRKLRQIILEDPTRARRRGIVITAVGVVALSPDALLVRLIDVDPWTLVFWRGVLLLVGLSLATAVTHRGRFVGALRATGRPGIALAFLFTGSTTLFVHSLASTSVANTLFLLSSAPLFAAILAGLVLGEVVERATLLAIGGAFLAVAVIVSGSFGAPALAGDLAALGAAACQAGAFVAVRSMRAPDPLPAMAASGAITALVVVPLAAPASVPADDVLILGLLGLVVLPVAFGLITHGPRFLPAPEVSLLMLLETVLGPLWVWLVLAEVPPGRTLGGGALLLAVLAVHFGRGLRRGEPPPGSEPVPPAG